MATTSIRPTPPAGYSYCAPTCYCRNCRRVEAMARDIAAEAQAKAEHATLAGDERLMQAMYPGTCAVCRGRFPAGTRIAYSRATRSARHALCTRSVSADTCPGCGVQRNGARWSYAAGYGPACPDCYDRLSE